MKKMSLKHNVELRYIGLWLERNNLLHRLYKDLNINVKPMVYRCSEEVTKEEAYLKILNDSKKFKTYKEFTKTYDYSWLRRNKLLDRFKADNPLLVPQYQNKRK